MKELLDKFGDGIYIIRSISDGYEARKVCEKIEELPDMKVAVALEPYRYIIAKKFAKRLENKDEDNFLVPSTKELMDIVFNSLKGK